MTKSQRNYSPKTLKILFGLSGNQCYHPKCTNNVIEPATESSDAAVIAQICHIYASSVDGPRGKTGLTNKELDSQENLLLLCPNHHTVVDKQFETYPAEMLKQWKRDHEAEAITNRFATDLDDVPSDVFSRPDFPTELVDQKIKDKTDILCKSRFFADFDRSDFSLTLARKLLEGELSGGTNSVRSQALAWCVRILSRTEELDKAEKYLEYAKKLGASQEIDIADAFILSQKGDRNAALSSLSSIDSPMSRSAALMIVADHDSPQGVINWLRTVGIDTTDLDPDGKRFLLGCQLELADWEAAQKSLDALTDDDLRDAPVLHHIVAITHLLKAVPAELRTIVRDQPPFEASTFPLDSGPDGIKARRLAHRAFIDAAKAARQLGCPLAERIDDEYALWLELTDPNPDKCAEGKVRLESKLRDPKIDLCLVRFGLQFGIELDNRLIEQEIERQIALNGEITFDAALARFALAFKQKTPEHALNYIIRYHNELTGHIDKKMILSLQIELFSQIGQLDKANKCLDILLEEGLSEAEEVRLRRRIAEAEGTDTVESLKEQFKKTDSLLDLENLVNELGARDDWEDLCEYSEILFERTRALPAAEKFASTLHKTQKNERLIEFLDSNKTIVGQSDKLQMLYCWTLYLEGDLLRTCSELAKLSNDWDDETYRTLQVNLAVSLGAWDSLSEFVAKEYNKKVERDAKELIYAARLALHSDSIPHAKELILEAVEKGQDDADILGTAYFLATNAGWEDQETTQWMYKAAALSGNDGPIWQMSLKEIWDQKQEWDRRESEISQQLRRGEIPMFLAAHSLNRSLSDLMLFPALVNLAENDLQRKGAIPAYSGKRQPLSLDTSMQIGIDATALLTLSFLDLLDEALDAFDMVHIPHSTLGWLFDEKWRVAFHQPSRIKEAHQIRDLLATDTLEKFSPSTEPDSDLSNQIGEELAQFIAEAEKGNREDGPRHIVVQSSPVHRIGSLMEEEADLTAHATVLSSCQSVVNKLQQKGLITASEYQKAQAYLQLQEKPWPNQPEIADGAILYLDYVAVKYFVHLGILEKLKAAGFKSVVSPRMVSEIDQLISYERISGEVKNAIERIRSAVNSRIESEKIKVGRLTNSEPSVDRSISEHPAATLFHSARYCDAIITDDRYLNQHANFGDGDISKPMFSTLDIIDMLVSKGTKTVEERLEYRTQLRRAGYIFVPVSGDELAYHLEASSVKDDRIDETAELKAIRENILCVRMTTWLQIPKEFPWLNTSLIEFSRVIKSLWKADADFSSTRARSDWLMNQIDIRGWAHRFGKENGDHIAKTGRGGYLLLLLTPLVNVPREVQDEYWNWVEEKILDPVKKQYPDLYSWITEEQRELIVKIADTDITEREAT